MDLTMLLTSVLSAGGGAGSVGYLVLAMYKHAIKKEQEQREEERRQRDDLLRRVDRLETEKIAKLEKKVEDHLAADNPAAVGVKLEGLTGTLEKVGDKLDGLSSNMAGLKMAQERDHEFIQNTYRSIQELRKEVHNGRN